MCIGNVTNVTWDALGADETSKVLTIITASMSIVGSSLIILSFCISKELRTVSRQILVYISIADFLTSGGNLVGAVAPNHRILGTDICAAQSLVTTSSCLSFMIWTTILGLYLYLSIAKGCVRPAAWLQVVFAVFGWVVPIAVTLAAYLLDILGDDQATVSAGWCWLRPDPEFPRHFSCRNAKLLWSLITGKGWEISSYFIVPVFYVLAKRHIVKESHAMRETLITPHSLRVAIRVNRKLTFIPVAYVLLRIWGTIRYILDVADLQSTVYGGGREDLYWTLIYLQAIGDNGQGLANFLLFFIFTDNVLSTFCGDRGQRREGSTQDSSETQPLCGSANRPHLVPSYGSTLGDSESSPVLYPTTPPKP